MDSSYWSISDILADSSRIPCTFNLDVPNLSHLRGDSSVDSQMHHQQSSQASSSSSSVDASSDTIREKSRLELPFWLAEMLALNDIVAPSLPRPYSQRVRNALNADASSVQLRSQANWWYALGVRLASLESQGTESQSMLLQVLSTTYSARLPNVYDAAQHVASGARGGGGAGLDEDGGMASQSNAAAANSTGGGGFGNRGSAVAMSAELMDFVNGLDESEKLGEYDAHPMEEMTRC